MKVENYNKRDKIASTLFDVIKYILTIVVIGNVLDKFNWQQALIGFISVMGIGIIAYIITPEKED
ncbi:MAG: hypothetical protein ABH886_09645 [Candidatus Desantisbacteria bacterium]